MTTFAELGVPEDLVASLTERGITEAFPIQAATLADSLKGLDICGRAPTGSGKTLAFSIPLVDGVERARPKSPRGLVLVPTRELAAQVQETIEPLAKARGLRVMSIYGGVGFEPQLKTIRRGVDIVVACPGRLNDLINRNALSLRDVDFVVIDEADRMADMGFLPEVKRLLDQTNADRQTLLFSATLDGDVDVLIRRYQHDPVKHEVVRPEEEEDNSLHLFWKAQRHERVDLCAQILGRTGPTVIFTRTKHGADRLAGQLGRQGVQAAAIHGGRSQPQRDRALSAFTKGQVQALVATDVAARGIHVDGVDCVIHFDVPEDHKTYVHRSGRTARAGATGTVVSLVEPDKARQVNQMQRQLQMAAGIISPDFRALPDEGPARPVVKSDSPQERTAASPRPEGERSEPSAGRSSRRGRSFRSSGRRTNGGNGASANGPAAGPSRSGSASAGSEGSGSGRRRGRRRGRPAA